MHRQTARQHDVPPEKALAERERRLRSLLELGQLIGSDLELDDMLLQIAKKAAEIISAERVSIFLHDAATDELYTVVALGMDPREIRIPASAGLAGHAFRTGETVNLTDAYSDPRFNQEVDTRSGYRTRSLLSVPFYSRTGYPLGAIQALNSQAGSFSKEDETFLKTFNSHAAVFIEMARLTTARFEALEQSHKELERLNRAKSRALNHLSHELRTPLSVVQARVRFVKRKLLALVPGWDRWADMVERNIQRLFDIQREADKILRVSHEMEKNFIATELEKRLTEQEQLSQVLHSGHHRAAAARPSLWLNLFAYRTLEKVKHLSSHGSLTSAWKGGETFQFPSMRWSFGTWSWGSSRTRWRTRPTGE